MSIYRYWSHEATSEWLFSINNYINHQQKVSLRQTEFINLIVDETSDISIKQMICICLRYVEKESGIIKEEVFKLGPIHYVSGEGKIVQHSNERSNCFFNFD
jgi:hypothetical protein